ncbi:hypothetical protein NQ317_017737 [Molorchus minor]|uniref:Uncharacterized protein n=1 Tax=Molorchus minor TaxID=1323400 RepID=A0ABQ9J0J5_9CUCU|nr:hypothetical protein NQ317_017737 [Molorchus minor]
MPNRVDVGVLKNATPLLGTCVAYCSLRDDVYGAIKLQREGEVLTNNILTTVNPRPRRSQGGSSIGGPSWIPVVGNLLELKKLSHRLGGQHLALAELARRFNTNVLGLKLGNDLVVTVFSYPVIRTVHSGEEYDGRPNNFF